MEILDLNDTPQWASGQVMGTQASWELVWLPLGNELDSIFSLWTLPASPYLSHPFPILWIS